MAKMVLQTLMHEGYLNECEVEQILQRLRANSYAFVAQIEEDISWRKQ